MQADLMTMPTPDPRQASDRYEEPAVGPVGPSGVSPAPDRTELERLRVEVAQLRAGCRDEDKTYAELWAHAEDLGKRAERAEAAIERVRALHTQGVMPDMCKECNHVPAADCPTLRALDTPASPKGAPDDR